MAKASTEVLVAQRFEALIRPTDGLRFYSNTSGRVLEMRSVRLHNGGISFTYTDATAQAQTEEEMEAENETLELRVRDAHRELNRLNIDLLRAKGRGGGRQHLEVAVPGGRQPRHPPAPQRGAPLHDPPCASGCA